MNAQEYYNVNYWTSCLKMYDGHYFMAQEYTYDTSSMSRNNPNDESERMDVFHIVWIC